MLTHSLNSISERCGCQLSCEKQNNPEISSISYKKHLSHFTHAVALPPGLPSQPGPRWKEPEPSLFGKCLSSHKQKRTRGWNQSMHLKAPWMQLGLWSALGPLAKESSAQPDTAPGRTPPPGSLSGFLLMGRRWGSSYEGRTQISGNHHTVDQNRFWQQ